MSTYEFTATVTAAGQIEVPSNVADRLPAGEQAKVTVTIGAVQMPVKGTSVQELRKYAGTMSASGAQELLKAIEEECETIDPDGWQ